MNARVVAKAIRARNLVALLELRDVDVSEALASVAVPPLYVVVFSLEARPGKRDHWSRTETDPEVARELYDRGVLDHVSEAP